MTNIKPTHTIDEALDTEVVEEGLHKEGPGVEHLPAPEEEKRQGSLNTQDQGEEDEDDVDPHEAEDLIQEEEKRQHVEE